MLDLQEEVRHVVRLAAKEHDPESSIAAVQAIVRMRAQIDAVTAGVVLQARSAGVSWTGVGRALGLSSETARRVYRQEVATRLVQRVAGQRRSALPAPATVAYQPEAVERAARVEWRDDSASNCPVRVAQLVSARPAPDVAVADAQGRFVGALSLMQRHAAMPLRKLGQKIGVSASYLSRVLAGTRFPSRHVTYRLAQECGADVDEIMALWEHAQHARSRLG
ncbi:helix-turn-helix domain-containing protein [Streptomyces sp. DB-54]